MITRPGPIARPQTDSQRILTVDEDTPARHALQAAIHASGWTSVPVSDVRQACDALLANEAPQLALVDWGGPGRAGVELVREIRAAAPAVQPYLILVTDHGQEEDVVSGLDAGADDYMVKPIVASELQARVRVGLRTLALQERLRAQVRELQATAAQVRQLQSLLPICSYCRRIRDDEHHWQHLDEYLSHHTHVKFTHGFCPQCYQQHVQPSLEAS